MDRHKAILKGWVMEKYWEVYTPNNRPYHYSYSRSLEEVREYRIKDLEYSTKRIQSMQNVRPKETEEFWSGNIDLPLLNVGDKLFIMDMDKEVVVEERIRTTEVNTYIYIVNHVIRTVESERQEDSKEMAEKRVESLKDSYRELIDELRNPEPEDGCVYRDNGMSKPGKNETWFDRWFG